MYSDYVHYYRQERDPPEYDQDVKDWIMAIFVREKAENFIRELQTSSGPYTMYMVAYGLTQADVKEQIAREKQEREERERAESQALELMAHMTLEVDDVMEGNEEVARDLQQAVALDCEMAALYNVHRMVSVGVVDYEGRVVYDAIVRPDDGPISLTHTPELTEEQVREGRPEGEVLTELAGLLKDKLVVFHDKRGDLAVMPGVVPRCVIDTYDITGKSLDDALAETGGDPRKIRHEAVEDARGTMVLARRLLHAQRVKIDYEHFLGHCRESHREPDRCPKLYAGKKQDQLEVIARSRGLQVGVKATKAGRRAAREEQRQQAERIRSGRDRWHLGMVRYLRNRECMGLKRVRTTMNLVRRHPREIFVTGLPKEVLPWKWPALLKDSQLVGEIESSRRQAGMIVLTVKRRNLLLIWTTVLNGWRGARVIRPDPPRGESWVNGYRGILDSCLRQKTSFDDRDVELLSD